MEMAPTTLLRVTVCLFALGAGTGVFGLGIGVVAVPVPQIAKIKPIP